jgi:hypothetical protein
MEKEFVTYELALRMKQLGFDESCFAFYGDENDFSMDSSRKNNPFRKTECVAPLFSQAFRWFREKFGLNHEISYAGREGEYNAFVNDYVYGNNSNSPSVFTYEEAELACLDKLIEIVESKSK